VRPEFPVAANGPLTIPAPNTIAGREIASPSQFEDTRPTMKLISEALSPTAPPVAGPFPVAASPAWPLLDALAPAVAEMHEPVRSTLVQLFGGLAAPAPATPAPAAPALPVGGPFPAAWAPNPYPGPAVPGAAGSSSGLVPADRVTTPLADVLQNLGRGVGVSNPAFAGLRLPGGSGSR
jgi:hypothetical protein